MESKESDLKSFIHYSCDSHFPLENIPFGVFYPKLDHTKRARCGTRIGDFAIDLGYLENKKLFSGPLFQKLLHTNTKIFDQSTLNAFMKLGRDYWIEARNTIKGLLTKGSSVQEDMETRNCAFYHINDVNMCLPAQIGDYTDFYSSYHHAYNVGCIIRGKDNAIQPNWLHLPVGYHGRASSIVVSGNEMVRPRGQVKPADQPNPIFSETKRLDFELEMGAFLGGDLNKLGHPIKCSEAEKYIFGYVILNDWSARDIQTWEYVPLGPFGAKNFCTTISPWIVTIMALEEFRVPLQKQDPVPLNYLQDANLSSFKINLETKIKTPKMENYEVIVNSNFQYLYWSVAQQLTHHTVTGCNMNPGDLLGTGIY
jgi:fumarylacetoacetase